MTRFVGLFLAGLFAVLTGCKDDNSSEATTGTRGQIRMHMTDALPDFDAVNIGTVIIPG